MTPHHYLHALHTIPQVNSQTMRKLLEYFDTPEAIWEASPAALKASGIGEKTLLAILHHRPNILIDTAWESLRISEITPLLENDPGYPKLLKEIPAPPPLIYKRGVYDWNSAPIITIVGSRHPTAYGIRVAETFAQELASIGICVASGLAFGIDSAAHKSAIEAKGNTIAVLGNSLDDASISPRSHLPLTHTILRQNGALLSEYPPVTAATPYTFPARNRILAGISQGTIVIEAATRSGSLITARYALEFNREVFAVPGSIFSDASAGPHELIRSGAKIATSIRDILEEIKLQIAPKQTSSATSLLLSPHEETILSILSSEPFHIDKILKTTTLETSQVQSTLVFLEVKGLIKNIGGMCYIRL